MMATRLLAMMSTETELLPTATRPATKARYDLKWLGVRADLHGPNSDDGDDDDANQTEGSTS